jgi:hypothetical protein
MFVVLFDENDSHSFMLEIVKTKIIYIGIVSPVFLLGLYFLKGYFWGKKFDIR